MTDIEFRTAVLLAACAAALLLWPERSGPGDARLDALAARRNPGVPHASAEHDRGGRAPPVRSLVRRLSLAAAAGIAAAVLLGPGWGTGMGVLVGVGGYRWLAHNDRMARGGPAEAFDTLPAMLDQLAVCLRAGLSLPSAIRVVTEVAEGRLATELAGVSTLLGMGAAPGVAWAQLRHHPALGRLARTVGRSADSGASLATAFQRLADDMRDDGRRRAEAAARRAGVLVMAPLGLCFLPAFMCLGVVPVVVGIATQLLR